MNINELSNKENLQEKLLFLNDYIQNKRVEDGFILDDFEENPDHIYVDIFFSSITGLLNEIEVRFNRSTNSQIKMLYAIFLLDLGYENAYKYLLEYLKVCDANSANYFVVKLAKKSSFEFTEIVIKRAFESVSIDEILNLLDALKIQGCSLPEELVSKLKRDLPEWQIKRILNSDFNIQY